MPYPCASDSIRFFLDALGVALDSEPGARLGPFHLIAVGDSSVLRRAAGCLPGWKEHGQRAGPLAGWLLIHDRVPLGLLIRAPHAVPEGPSGDFAFLEFSELTSFGAAPDASARERWSEFKTEYFGKFVNTALGADLAESSAPIGIDGPTGDFRLWWSVARGGPCGNVSIPLFLDVFTPNTDFVRVLLACALPKIQAGQRVLVLGCGAGPEAVLVALNRDVAVDAVDIGDLEVANARASVAYHDLARRIRVWRSDAFQNVPDAYDTILFNAPVTYETALSWSDHRGVDHEGRIMLSVLSSLDARLRPGGALYVMAFPDRFGFVRDRASHLSFTAVDPGKNSFRIYEVRPAERTLKGR
ncbi:MAG: methyltransferase [Acidobacteriota bacterium]